MFKLGMQNLRRLKSVEPIDLKPITILVGRNSSGKSTFLRTLPLLRQSILTRTSSPILWYGDYVDFGSFESSSGSKIKTDPIVLTFAVDRLEVDNNPSPYVSRYRSFTDEYKDISVSIHIVPIKERTRIGKIELSIGDWYNTRYEIIIDESDHVSSIKVNDVETIDDIDPYQMIIRSNSLLPDIVVVDKNGTMPPFDIFSTPVDSVKFFKALDAVLRPLMDGRLKKDKIDELIVNMIAAGFPNREYIKSFGKSGPKVLTKFLGELVGADNKKVYPKTERILAVSSLVPLFRALNTRLKRILGATLYIGPARARSERYYRYQDLAVSEIDPDGKNFPVFLNSLSNRQLLNLSNWIKGLFNYGISVTRERDHISINVVENDYKPNVIDVGYGISQILPVLGQIWWSKYRPRPRELKSSLTMLVIEQPELHLHPAHQALLADAFVAMAKPQLKDGEEGARVHYIVETHSETLVNRMGELIASGKIENSDVQVVIFERNSADEAVTDARVVAYDADGVLLNWPYGFFQPGI